MHRLAVLTVDAADPTYELSIVVTASDGSAKPYQFIGRMDDLLYYRDETISHEDARKLAGFDRGPAPSPPRRR